MKLKIFGSKNDLAWSYLTHGLTIIFPIATTMLLVKTLGLEEYGVYIYWQTWILVADSLAAYGFRLSATVRIAGADNHEECKIYSVVQATKIALIGLILVLFNIFTALSDQWGFYILLSLLITLVGNYLTASWYLNGKREFALLAKSTAIQKITFLIFVVAYSVAHDAKAQNMLISYSVATVLAGYYCHKARKSRAFFKYKYFKLDKVARELKTSFDAFVSQLSVTVYTNINTIAIGHFVGYDAVGAYSLAEKIYKAAGTLAAPAGRVFMPIIAMKNKGSGGNTKGVRIKLLMVTGAVFACVSMAVNIFSDAIIYMFIKSEVDALEAVKILKILSIGILFFSLASISTYILSSLHKMSSVRTISLFAAASSVLLTYPTLQVFGVIGLAILSVVTMASIALTQIRISVQ